MESKRREIISEIENQLKKLKSTGFAKLIPEIGSNMAYAMKDAGDSGDVAAVPGRIRNAMGKPVFLKPAFGASSHMASAVIEMMKHDPSKRCAMNIKYSEKIVKALEKMGLCVLFIDRMEEPGKTAGKEGASMPWVIGMAVRKAGKVPDAIYHGGSVGKEPIVQIIGENPEKVAGIVLRLLDKLEQGC